MQTKRFKDNSHDADIHLDWQNRSVQFTNCSNLFGSRKARVATILSYPLFVVTLYLISLSAMETYNPHPQPVPPPPTMPSMATLFLVPLVMIVAMVLVIYLGARFTTMEHHMRTRLRRSPYITKIQNPSGTIEYDCRFNQTPLVDLLFDDAVSAKLIKANMVEGLNKKRKKRKRMIITMDGTANGTLTIKEYR